MAAYDLGDGVNLEHTVYDRDHQLTSATVALTITKPDGSTATPVISQPSTGEYRAATFVADQPGLWMGVWQVSGAVTDVQPVVFTVADPSPMSYTTLPLAKASLGKTSDDIRDDLLEQAIVTASRRIDRRTGRRFYPDTTLSARTFPVVGQSFYDGQEQVLLVDDFATSAGLAVATGGTGNWSAVTGWEPGPDNAAAYGQPFTRLCASAGWLPATGRVQVTARWGWPSVPEEISQATLLLACRLYRRKDSPQGVLGSSEWGPVRVSRLDPDVEDLIDSFVLPAFA